MHKKYFDIVVFKTFAEIKAEAARSYLGIIWWVFEPLLYLTVFYIVFAVVLQRGEGEDFVFFLLIGLVVWKWFASSILNGANSIVSNAGLMRQVYLPKYIFVHISVLVNLYKFVIVFFLLVIFILAFSSGFSHSWILIPILLAVQLTLILFCTSLVAAIVPLFPDIRVLVENGLMLMFFLSGIFFRIGEIPPDIKKYFDLNPMAILIDSYRTVILDHSFPDWLALFVIFAYSVIGYILVLLLIHRLDKVYPKVILR